MSRYNINLYNILYYVRFRVNTIYLLPNVNPKYMHT